MSCTNSPSWVRLRHSTIGTISPYAVAAESPVSQCRVLGVEPVRVPRAVGEVAQRRQGQVAVVGAGVAEDEQRGLRAEGVGVGRRWKSVNARP